MSVSFLCKPSNSIDHIPETISSITCLLHLLQSGHYFPALVIPGLGTRQLGTALTCQSPLKLFKLANPIPAYPALSIPSCRNHNRVSCPHAAPAHFLTDPGASSCGPTCLACCALFLGICEYEKLPLWPSFLCLHVSPYLTKIDPLKWVPKYLKAL